MAIDLVSLYKPYVDEQFTAESKIPLLTNDDFDWTGAHSVKIYKITTAPMNDYDREGTTLTGSKWSRYGEIASLDATTEEMQLKRDRSFTFAIDKLDIDETADQLNAAHALARQIREVVIPEADKYVYTTMCANAGSVPEAVELTAENIYDEILKGSEALDDAEAPETDRVLVVTPATYTLMKKNSLITFEGEVGAEMRKRGVIGMLDGCKVVRVPAKRLPEGFGFMIAHPSATVAPNKLNEFNVHLTPPGVSGNLIEGRVVYDAFVLDNKKKGIYYQAVPTAVAEDPEVDPESGAESAE